MVSEVNTGQTTRGTEEGWTDNRTETKDDGQGHRILLTYRSKPYSRWTLGIFSQFIHLTLHNSFTTRSARMP